MKVSDLLESRRTNWLELEQLCSRLEGATLRRPEPLAVTRFSALYRAVCADLALADAYQLPPETVDYLHRLVGRAHNQLYRGRPYVLSTWARQLLVDTPQRLYRDGCVRLAFCLFWGIFLLSALLANRSGDFARQVIGEEAIYQMEEMYSEPIGEMQPDGRTAMVGFYISNNAGIGLRCFAYGLLGGIGGLFMLVFNGGMLGAAFGHMAAQQAQRANFFHFVTAHGPFELTAIVLSAAAGMRMGFSLLYTRGLQRVAALRQGALESLPTISLAVVLFLLAALIEGFLSPSAAPYWVKAFVALLSTGLLLVYFLVLGNPRRN